MREIKFRAENKKTGILHNLVGFMTEYDEGDNILLYVCRSTIEATGETVEFVADTLQQYTGLEDKNGKEIYEGDINVNDDNRKSEVVFYAGGFYLNYGKIEHEATGSFAPFDRNIIGNIYENPELLLNHPHRGINS